MVKNNALHWMALASLSSMLAACGGEREEPFSPSEPEEVRDALTVSLVDDNQTGDEFFELPATSPEVSSRRLEVIRDQDDFEELINAYTFSDDVVTIPDFEEGQVVLYDSGWFNNAACAQQLNLRRIEAFSITEDESIAEVVLTYDRSPADDDDTCDDEIPLRQWEFHYVETRADLIVVETVRGLDERGGSNNSRSRSSSSSSSSSSSIAI